MRPSFLPCPPLAPRHGAPHPAPLHRRLSTPTPPQATTSASRAARRPGRATISPESPSQRPPSLYLAADHRRSPPRPHQYPQSNPGDVDAYGGSPWPGQLPLGWVLEWEDDDD